MYLTKIKIFIRHQWLMPIIPASQEDEVERIEVQGHPRQIVLETPSPK
jgi:hypothetical protein